MLIKWVGASLLSIAVLLVGCIQSIKSKRRLKGFALCKQTVEQLKSQVVLLSNPPAIALENLSGSNSLASALRTCPASQWQSQLMSFGMAVEEARILLSLLEDIPALPLADQRRFDAAYAQIDEVHKRCAKRLDQEALLYPKLGILGALAVFLILL